MFKGEPGTRKSTCALSYPGPQYWFSWDRKMVNLKLPAKHWKLPAGHYTHDDYSDWNKAEIKLKQLQTTCPYKTIIVDSITSCGDAIMGQTKKLKSGQTRKSGAQSGKMISGIMVNELEDYNAEASAILDLVSMLKDVHEYHNVNVIIIAHVIQAEYRSITGETHFARSIVTAAKKVAAKIPVYCQEIYHFNIDRGFDVSGEGSYSLLTQHTGDDYAITSLPLPKKIVFGNDPLYSRWIKPALDEISTSETTSQTTETTEKKGW